MIIAPDGTNTGCGSHQPALRALARFTKVYSAIEFGAGVYSSHLFLDKEAFPDLTSLVTFEHKKQWADSVANDDRRHTVVITNYRNFKGISAGMRSDFVFVDSAPHDKRLELLDHALQLAPIVGIHDCKASGIGSFDCKYIKAFNSKIQTLFASNIVDLSGLEL